MYVFMYAYIMETLTHSESKLLSFNPRNYSNSLRNALCKLPTQSDNFKMASKGRIVSDCNDIGISYMKL